MDTVGSLDELLDLVAEREATYLRYSPGPEQDAEHTSRDYEADVDLPGLPVTPLTPPAWWSRAPEDWVARRVCKYLDLADADPTRRPWVLSGRVIDSGPDHEPLLVDIEPIAWLSDAVVEQAQRIYRERFEVGRATPA